MRGAALGALLLLAAGAAAAQAGEKPATPPGDTISAGSLGLLLAHPDRPGTVETIARGLGAGDPGVRAAAARVAWMVSPKSLAADLTRALAAETDLEAAREEVEALAVVAGADAEPALLRAAERLRPRLAGTVAEAVARTRRRAAVDLLPKLRPLGLSPGPILRLLAAAQVDALVPVAVAAVRDQDASLWRAVLEACPADGCAAIDGMVKASLTSSDPGLREATYQHLAARAKEGTLDPALAAAGAASVEANGDGAGAGSAAVKPREFSPPLRPGQGVMRTAEYPPGFVAAVLEASGCKPKAVVNPAGEVKFREDGRPAAIGILSTLTDQKCKDAVTALLSAAAAPLWRLPDVTASDVIVLRLDAASLSCVDARQELPDTAAAAFVIGGRIKEPRKVKDVPPLYPGWARQQGVQGMIVIGAEIGTSGCVRTMRVLDGKPGLAFAALAAVSRWRYTPTLLNGVPVPVMMTVTVNFRLAY